MGAELLTYKECSLTMATMQALQRGSSQHTGVQVEAQVEVQRHVQMFRCP